MKIAEAYVEVRADTDKFDRELQSDVARSGQKAGKTLATNLTQVFAAGALLKGMHDSIDAASNLNEQVNRTSLIFPNAKAKIDEFAETSTTKMGMSERAFRDATSSIGGLLQNLGFTEQAAADQSLKLTQLAADLGSAFNKDPEEAILAIGSALRGEAEPIRAYNVMLDDAKVKAKALELGLYSGKGAIDDSAKATAALALITEQTAVAQGDFAATADGAANAQRIAKAEAENSAASLGQNFLPIYERVVQVVGLLAKGFGELPAPLQVATVGLLGVVAFAGPVSKFVGVVKDLKTSFVSSAQGAGAMSRGMRGAAVAAGVLGAAFVALEVIDTLLGRDGDITDEMNAFLATVGKMSDGSKKASAEIVNSFAELSQDAASSQSSLNQALGLVSSGFDDTAARADAMASAFDEVLKSSPEIAQQLVASLDQVVRGAEEGRQGAIEFVEGWGLTREVLDGFKTKADNAVGATDALTGALDQQNPVVEETAKVISRASDSASNLADYQDHAADRADKLTISEAELRDELANVASALEALIGGTLTLEDANQALYEGSEALVESFKENGKTLDISTAAGRANRDVVKSQVENIIAHGTALLNTGASQEEATTAIELGRQALLAQMTQLGYTTEEAQAYVDQLGLTPENIVTAVSLANTEAMKTEINDIITRLGPIDDPREAKVQALLDEGKYEQALAMLKALERDLVPRIVVRDGVSIDSGTVYVKKSARGRYVPAGANMLTTVSEPGAGAEAILPLDNASRLDALLSDPRIGGPIAAAMGGDGRVGVSGGVGRVTNVTVPVTVYGAEDRYVLDLIRRIRVLERSQK